MGGGGIGPSSANNQLPCQLGEQPAASRAQPGTPTHLQVVVIQRVPRAEEVVQAVAAPHLE
jgi:hypothetical protein